MASAADTRLYAACLDESRVLVTLDLDFTNPLRFDPSRSQGIAAGIAVIEINRPHLHTRHRKGKSDGIDAEAAAVRRWLAKPR